MRDDYAVIRDHISTGRARLRELRGRRGQAGRVRHAPSAARLPPLRHTAPGGPSSSPRPIEALQIPPGHLVLQTLRSHDQYNTTIYGLSDRYRGIEGGRRVVMVNPRDIDQLGFEDGDLVDLITHWPGTPTSAGPRRSASSATRPRAAPRRPTTRRPTRWCRWTPPPWAATRPPRSR